MNAVQFRLRILLAALAAVMALGTAGFMLIEGMSAQDAFYFSIVTISTVGYGDVHPVSPPGKALAVVLIITGVGTFLGLIANATELMLNRRETRIRLEKLNVVIGLFFSEAGTSLLSYFSRCDSRIEDIRNDLIVGNQWSDREFAAVGNRLRQYEHVVDVRRADLQALRVFLEKKSGLLLRIMENPNLLEHEQFTDLLMAVFHVREELEARSDLSCLPSSDLDHLSGDLQRAYTLLLHQWLSYMKHLKKNYPFLFSLAVRTNPFDRDASAVVA